MCGFRKGPDFHFLGSRVTLNIDTIVFVEILYFTVNKIEMQAYRHSVMNIQAADRDLLFFLLYMLRAEPEIPKIIPKFFARSFNSYEPIDFEFHTFLMFTYFHHIYLSFNSVNEVKGREEAKDCRKKSFSIVLSLFTTFYFINRVETEVCGGSM